MGKQVDPDLLARSGLQPLPGESTIGVVASATLPTAVAALVTSVLLHLSFAVLFGFEYDNKTRQEIKS
jgi:hypothetical protein